IDRLDARRSAVEDNLRAVALITGELAQAATADEVAAVIIRLGLPAMGASAGGLMIPSPDGQELRLLRAEGVRPEALQRFGTLPGTSDMPAGAAFRDNEPLFVGTSAECVRRFPSVVPALMIEGQSRAAVPLRGRDRTLGVLTLTFARAHAFDDDGTR